MTHNIQRLHCAVEINILATDRVATVRKTAVRLLEIMHVQMISPSSLQ